MDVGPIPCVIGPTGGGKTDVGIAAARATDGEVICCDAYTVYRGLHTCAQASFANYPHIIRNHITIGDEEVVICGMALGYGDMQAPENVWRTEREDVDVFTRFLGFE